MKIKTYYPKDRGSVTTGVNTALFKPTGNKYDVRGELGKKYGMGGWFMANWFPCGKWWGKSV
jgi:hypothetical protein